MPAKTNIQAVLFDADGVIIHPFRFAAYLEREHGISRTMTEPFFRGVFLECLTGQRDLKTAVEPFLTSWDWNSGVASFLECWLREDDAPDHAMLAEVAALRKSGTRCYLATNQERYRAAYMREQMRFGEQFDGIFASCYLGVMKPDPAFFTHVATRLGVPPEQILFWDDAPANVEQARACGWCAELFSDHAGYRATMLARYIHHG
jgi:putative hydrolase of the HAD superfamily